jgi:tRNA nucleotidyltransferase (CCA-adding enzyme)
MKTVVATHTNTDFDAFASLLAARRLYPGAIAAVPGALNRNVREFWRLHADELEGAVDVSRLDLDAIRRLIVVETVHASRLGELEQVARDPSVEKSVFDHHAHAPPDWADPAAVVISEDGALTTTLLGVLAEREIDVTPLEATVFALGIHEDTGSLTYPATTQRDAEALAWCLRHGARQDVVSRFLHTPLAEDERNLLNAIRESLETHVAHGIEVLVAGVSWPRYVEGVSNLAHKLVDETDCKALIVLVEMDERVFAVTRSRTPDIDAAVLAAALGGGGHPQAASANFRGSLADARKLVTESLEAAVRAPLLARDVMSSPARVVDPEATVAQAMVLCQRYGMSGLLVASGDQLVGTADREDLDKAIAHGLSHAPVKAVMGGRVPTVDEDAPLAELQQLLATSDAGRVAVLRDGKLTGVVTRSDVLRALGERIAEPQRAESIADELARLERLAPIFGAIAAISEPYEGVYLVGGTVRDILLGEESFDVDIAVEGDAIAFARALADELDGDLRTHEKFATARVFPKDGQHVDVVTARTEFYDAPGSLPTVEHASIREDLLRRDFTINAMAASLKGEDFGRLVDPFGGRRDLASGTIRVLHNLSFIDDPTRIFRAVRYENRYGFRMDASTLRLARGCIEMGLVGDLSSSARLHDELVLLLEEEEIAHSILRLAELGLAPAIHPHLAADEEAVRLISRVDALQAELAPEAPRWRLRLAVLARRLPSEEVLDWLDRLKVRRRDAKRIAEAVTVAPRLVERLADDRADPAEVVALAERYAPDAPLLALALADVPALRDYFARLRNVRLEVTGADLAELGLPESPRVGEVLDELRRRKLRGELDGRESELAAARELVS